MGTLMHDLRYAVRLLLKNPGFTVVAVLALALGIGANSTIFSLANSVFLRPLPVSDPGSLVWLFNDRDVPVSYPDYLDYRREADAFSGALAYSWVPLNLGSAGEAEHVTGVLASANYFELLGVKVVRGRGFLPEEDQVPGAPPVAVISDALWQRRFAGDPEVIGKPVVLNGQKFSVIGVLPPGFAGTEEAFPRDIWVPLTMRDQLAGGAIATSAANENRSLFTDRNARQFNVMARLKPGVSLPQAQAKMDQVAAQLASAHPETNANRHVLVYAAGNGRPSFRAMFRPVTWILLALVALVLLIACANVANLLLARSSARRKEVAIRIALGASRGRLIRQLMTESVLLALLGGAGGLVLSMWTTSLLMALKPSVPLPININVSTDWRVVSFTFIFALVAGAGFGLVPALQASKPELVPVLKDETSAFGYRHSLFSLRNLLVISQVAMSLVVLVGAGLFLRSLRNAQSINPGFDAPRVLSLSLATGAQGYDENKSGLFYEQLLARVQALPGVQAASIARSAPLSYLYAPSLAAPTIVEGNEPRPGENPPVIGNNAVGLNFFQTLGIPLVRGRDFTAEMRAGTPGVAIINETMAHAFFASADPIGKHLRVMRRGGQAVSSEIIGVVRDSKYLSLGEDPTPFVYFPYQQNYSPAMTLLVRSSGDPKSLTTAVRHEVQTLDPNLPPFNVITLSENIDISLFPARFGALLLGGFGVLALVLATVGIYGVMSYSVSKRTHEIGIRMALGAQANSVLRLVVGQGMVLALIGVVVGLAASFALTRVVKSLLYGVSATDLLTFTAIAVLLLGVALLACLVPGRRATKVDPLVALRYE
jgi:macrolide transport system ATP-binding/permease protein